MPNKNYVKGRRKEYAICEELRKKGFDIVQRTAGSHCPFDVIAIDIKCRAIKLIQSKPTNYKADNIINKWKQLNNMFKCEFIVD